MQNRRYSTAFDTSYIDVGDGPTVVLAPGYLCDAAMWTSQVEALSQEFRVIVPDIWGHGASGRLPDRTNTTGLVARQYLGFLNEIGVDRFAIVGHSFGGMWGAELALFAPDRLFGLALLGSYLGPEEELGRMQFNAMLDAAEGLGQVSPPLVEAILANYFTAKTLGANPPFIDTFRSSLSKLSTERLMDSIIPIGRLIFDRRDALEDMKSVQTPSMVMTGEYDVARPPREGRTMADILGCAYVEIADAAHVSILEAPVAINTALLGFLREVAR